MIDPYFGEFLINPVPLEMGLNYCNHSCAFCSSVDQPITLLNLRTKRAGDVRVGDVLLGFDRGEGEPYRTWQPTVVEEVFHRRAPAIRAVLRSGREVVCTPDHHWYTGRAGAIEYAPLVNRDGTLRQGKRLHHLPLDLLPEHRPTSEYMVGYIRGVLEGDASVTPYGAWRIALTDTEVLARIASYAIRLGWGHYTVQPHRMYHAEPQHRPMWQIYFPVSSPVAQFMNGPCALESSQDYWVGWMAGIYDAEGSMGDVLRIAQYRSVNQETYERICAGFWMLGFRDIAREDRAVRLRGGVLDAARFCQITQPAIPRKANPLLGGTLTQEIDPVVRVEHIGEVEVASFRTSTHNYISGGYLSRNCFANLNNRQRKANVKGIMALLADYPNRRTLTAQLLQQGYPVLISNRVDLLAPSNAHIGLPIVRTMRELGIPMAFQTRGGRPADVDELLGIVGDTPSVWYISICQLDDELRRRIEPGAPSIDARFALMERLAALGHTVTMGLNPLVREWLPDPRPLIVRARDCGAVGMWTERLHFNYRQVRNMTPRESAAIGDDLLARAQKRRADPDDMAHFIEARHTALELGLEVYSIGQGCRSDFFTRYHEVYQERTFATMQDWVNLCFDNDLQGVLIPFDAFASFMAPHFPRGTYPIDSYLGAVAHNLWWEFDVPPQMTYRQLLSIIWRDTRIRYNPARLPCFAYAARWDDGAEDGKPGWIAYVDEQELPYLVFNPDGFSDYYAHVDLPSEVKPAGELPASQLQPVEG